MSQGQSLYHRQGHKTTSANAPKLQRKPFQMRVLGRRDVVEYDRFSLVSSVRKGYCLVVFTPHAFLFSQAEGLASESG